MTSVGAKEGRGADALVQALRGARVKKVFTLSGNHVMPVFDAIIGSGIDLIHVRHEAAAVHMADAYARLTGEVGIAMVTGGPGHANAVSALYTATMAESPVVLISGHAPLNELGKGAFQEMAQADMALPASKGSWMCRSPAEVALQMRKAIALARAGRPGAVHLSIPSDCLEARAVQSNGESAAPAMTIRHEEAKAMLEQLHRAKSPLILAGPASLTKTGRVLLKKLEDTTGIPVIGMESPRGVADPSLGAFAEMLAKSDCILLLGKRLDFTLKFGRAPALSAECRFVQIDPEAAEVERTRAAVGDRLVANALSDVVPAFDILERNAKRRTSGWLDEVRAAIAYRPAAWDTVTAQEPDRLHPVHALRPLQSILDSHPDSVLVSDGGEFGQWAQACLSAPNRVINGVAGAIGPGIPFALAARVAKPDAPVIAAMGDGTFGFHAAEIDTAVRYALPAILLVGNDARWNAEYQIQVRDYGVERAKGCELIPARYEKVAEAFGGHGEYVTDATQLMPAVHRAIDSKLPACVNVMIAGAPAPVVRR